jgi:dipeptidyl aminopeptidase/acylaminoacyl peptidase
MRAELSSPGVAATFAAAVFQAKAMKAALESSHKPYEWMELRGEGHGVYDEETRREVYERILEFLGRHLQTGAAATAAR